MNYVHEMERSVGERVKRGKCIENARYSTVFVSSEQQGQKTYRFKCPANYSDFRQGDRIRLHQGEPLLTYAELTWLGDGYSDSIGEYFDLSLESQNGNISIVEGGNYIVDQTIVDLEKLYHAALEEASSREHGRERILSLFLDDKKEEPEDTVDPNVYGSAWDQAESHGFNDSQQEAIANAVAASWYQLFAILASVSNLVERELKQLFQGDIFNREAFATSLDLPERHSLDCTVKELLAIHGWQGKRRAFSPKVDFLSQNI